MIERTITIINKLGLHARAAAKFVTIASEFKADIKVSRNGRIVNGKSIMGMMMLAAAKNTEIVITADGSDEQKMLDVIEVLINDYFGEGE
ncbi:MAG: HPr family phosphocarrier protein [Methylophaga sp.]|nr:HPr family phosphocarrier protein [Methylophaga sp.]